MKTTIHVLCLVAVVIVLAAAMLIGWLWTTKRLDAGRLEQIRVLLATPAPDARARAAQARPEIEAAAQRDAEAARRVDASLASQAHLRHQSRLRRQESLIRRRLEDERRLLLAGLDEKARVLDRRQARVEQREQVVDGTASAGQRERAREQLDKAVRQLESIPPRQARAILMALVDRGRADRAVAYLDAMSPRCAAKVIGEFRSEREVEVATELLEALRTFGVDETDLDHGGDVASAADRSAD